MMRSARHPFAPAVLIAYALLAVGAEPLHTWQVGGCGDSCRSGMTGRLADAYRAAGDRCEHEHLGLHEAEHSAPQREPHDPSECVVCRILGQAQDKVVPASLAVSDDLVAAVPAALPEFSPQPCSTGFRSRAPPTA